MLQNIDKISVADPDLGSGAILTHGSGNRIWKKSGSGIQNEHLGLYFRELSNNFVGFKYLNSLMWNQLLDQHHWYKYRILSVSVLAGMPRVCCRNLAYSSLAFRARLIFTSFSSFEKRDVFSTIHQSDVADPERYRYSLLLGTVREINLFFFFWTVNFKPVLWIQHFKWIRIRIPGFDDQNLRKKIQLKIRIQGPH